MTEKELFKATLDENYISKQKIYEACVNGRPVRINQNGGKFYMKKAVAAIAAVALLCISTVTVFAVSKFLSAEQAADVINKPFVAAAFKEKGAVTVNENVTDGKYMVNFLGVANGKSFNLGNESNNKTYAVVAIANTDGTPLTSENSSQIYVSPLISGLNPTLYNIHVMKGGFSEKIVDGILYRLIECDSLEIFADRQLYLCVSEGSFYNNNAFIFDEATGSISVNEAFVGLNVIFNLPLDKSKANQDKANEYINSIFQSKPEETDTASSPSAAAADRFRNADGTYDIKAIIENAKPIEQPITITTRESDGKIAIDSNVKINEPFVSHCSSSADAEKTTTLYYICTLQENDTLQLAMYVITEPIR